MWVWWRSATSSGWHCGVSVSVVETSPARSTRLMHIWPLCRAQQLHCPQHWRKRSRGPVPWPLRRLAAACGARACVGRHVRGRGGKARRGWLLQVFLEQKFGANVIHSMFLSSSAGATGTRHHHFATCLSDIARAPLFWTPLCSLAFPGAGSFPRAETTCARQGCTRRGFSDSSFRSSFLTCFRSKKNRAHSYGRCQ